MSIYQSYTQTPHFPLTGPSWPFFPPPITPTPLLADDGLTQYDQDPSLSAPDDLRVSCPAAPDMGNPPAVPMSTDPDDTFFIGSIPVSPEQAQLAVGLQIIAVDRLKPRKTFPSKVYFRTVDLLNRLPASELLVGLDYKTEIGTGLSRWYLKNANNADYRATCKVLSDSDERKAGDMAFCGYQGFHCEQLHLCFYCCKRRQLSILNEFGPAFHRARKKLLIVIGLSHDPNVASRCFLNRPDPVNLPLVATDPGSAEIGTRFLDIIIRVMREAHKGKRNRLFTGSIGGPEFAVRLSPYPTVLPHFNAISWCDEFTDDELDSLRVRITNEMNNSGLFSGLHVTIWASSLDDPDRLARALTYLLKPMDLNYRYSEACCSACSAHKLEIIRENVRTVLQWIRTVGHRKARATRFGACHPQHKLYLGAGCKTARPRSRGKTRQVQKEPIPSLPSGGATFGPRPAQKADPGSSQVSPAPYIPRRRFTYFFRRLALKAAGCTRKE
jgi:hypothetical protein